MDNIKDLRNELCGVFDDLKSKKIDVSVASEINNCAGKIINSLKVELEYYHLTDEKPDIDFIKSK